MTKQELLISGLLMKDPYGFFVAVQEVHGWEMACRMAEVVIEVEIDNDTDPRSETYAAAELFLNSQDEYPECAYCDYRIYPNRPDDHSFCEEQMKLQDEEEWDGMVVEAAEEGPYDDDRDEDEDYITPGEVYNRALHHFGGNREMAREAASQFPGDFI